ncbi:MAG: DNA-3-methyladenine glycosylase I [Saprospiraceae bacterium]|nr:DNA-3-methyladenine glycosylase I [Saprospiraceae bacterium]
MDKKRCTWCLKDKVYMDYHDNVWGVPEFDDARLFEFINLEGAQAGLSWYSILVRKEGYKNAFANWDAEQIARFNDKDIKRLLNDPGIIRNKLKVNATIVNAKAFLEIQSKEGFSNYLWDFVGGKPIINNWTAHSEIPATTELSQTISKDLKSRGFKFVGPTIVYAFMQAVGIVDDHVLSCWKRTEP